MCKFIFQLTTEHKSNENPEEVKSIEINSILSKYQKKIIQFAHLPFEQKKIKTLGKTMRKKRPNGIKTLIIPEIRVPFSSEI